MGGAAWSNPGRWFAADGRPSYGDRMGHAVLFSEFPIDHLDAVAAAVGEAYGIPEFDARAKIRRGWGFLERDATPERAAQIVAGLRDRGVAAFAVDRADLLLPSEPQVIKGFQMTEDGFLPVRQLPGAEGQVPWPEILILAAGGFSEEIIRREAGGKEADTRKLLMSAGIFMLTGIPVGLLGGRKKEASKKVVSQRLFTFGRIVTESGEQFAFHPDHFDFSGLGPGKQLNAAANFHAFFEELARRTPARLNRGARFVVENKSLTLANYQSFGDLETELTWLLNVPAG